jgi:hypothetical protein
MSTWTPDELERIAGAQEMQIVPVRRNGELRRPTPIWVVQAGDDLYVRPAYGADKGWHGVARTSRHAQISAGDVNKRVAIEDADDAVDAAYRHKYGGRYAAPSARRSWAPTAASSPAATS